VVGYAAGKKEVNQFNCLLNDDENVIRHQRFREELEESEYLYLSGYSTDKTGTWPKESSYLIFSEENFLMQNLAAEFGQNAFLKVSYISPTQFLVLEPMKYVAA
jgi:hypothetical protein